ncbi:MAG: 2-dehydropantoate 2-reductase family protein [Paucimonas sp.]|nr:2-dehydropantoate 2-reductase family protein [Paucimonas sp.]
MRTETGTIAVFGAGSVGCFIGGSLLHAGADVVLVGRARLQQQTRQTGLALSDHEGRKLQVLPAAVRFEQDPAALAGARLILVTVKSADTAAAAAAIATYAAPDALVISFQNGVGNDAMLRASLTQPVLGGIVPFNVVQTADARFHRGTEGQLLVESSPQLEPWLDLFRAAHLPLQQRTDFLALQWGKLLMNLNNGVNALSGLPLREQLSQRGYRLCTAALMTEALQVLQAAGICPAKASRIAPRVMPFILRLPDFLFTRVAAASLRIDPSARSSTWEDLQAGRRTEVDFLNGAVVRLAAQLGRAAPANERMVALIRQAEAQRNRGMPARALLAALQGRA